MTAGHFSTRLLKWFDRHGRHDLPWQHPRNAYRVWLAEVMLQQTQVTTVIPYYRRFLRRFPGIAALACAPLDDVLALWSGLGYYARARNLHAAAQIIVREHDGRFPQDFDTVLELPGIGRSTAGAILAQAFGQRHAILDGNVRRVLARWAAIPGWPGAARVQQKLWTLAEHLLPGKRLADYTQALMDLGATVCTARQPRCAECPLQRDCKARAKKLIAEIPAPRPRRMRPLKREHLLLIRDPRGRLLLERRPPRGIWGGLWSPPLNRSGRWTGARQQGICPVIHHGFTHFDLELQPVLLKSAARTAAANQRWATLAEAQKLGLAAPVRQLLKTL
ncbi:MAG: A/G-specific adenine glycosylase [Pseudomonadota bacterium]